jgi:hypothetical protein
MKNAFRLCLILTVLGAAAIQAQAQNITSAEREFIVNHLQKTRANLEQATKGLSPAQWNFKPNPFQWSIAECVEHLALGEELVLTYIKNQVMNAPPPPARSSDEVKKGDQAVLDRTANRMVLFRAPEPLKPQQLSAAPEELVKQFMARRERTIEFAKTAQELRSHYADGPPAPSMDGYQWLLLMSGHSERHTMQLLQVKANPNFPKQ